MGDVREKKKFVIELSCVTVCQEAERKLYVNDI